MVLSPQQMGGGWQKPPGKYPQQGTLFRAPKPVNPWPRGYTPERMQEVRDSVLVGAEGSVTAAPFKPGQYTGHAGPDQLLQTIARSTAPMDDIAPNAFTDSIGRRHGRAEIGIRPGYGGQHSFDSYGNSRMNVGHKSGDSVMHELGHRASFMAMTEHSDVASPEHLGQEEAFADDYRATHFRRDPRDGPEEYTGQVSAYESRDGWKGYVRGRFPGQRNQTGRAFNAYTKSRTTEYSHARQNALYAVRLAETKRKMGRGPDWEEQLPLYHGLDMTGGESHRWGGRP